MSPRDLDALIAERVMGWTEIGRTKCVHTPPHESELRGMPGPLGPQGAMPAFGKPPFFVPYYSTTGDGLLAVVEAMRKRGWSSSTLRVN